MYEANDNARGAGRTVSTTGPGDSGPLILVVDDNDVIRRAVRTALERAGYGVLEATNGEMALDLLDFLKEDAASSAKIDLVLTDVEMPVMGGLELAAAMDKLELNIPVVLMTGSGSQAAADTGLPLLQKPFEPDELLAAVAAARKEVSQ